MLKNNKRADVAFSLRRFDMVFERFFLPIVNKLNSKIKRQKPRSVARMSENAMPNLLFITSVIFSLFLSVNAFAGHLEPFKSVSAPKENPQTPEKIELGKKLFFDRRLSGDGTMSCATCHNPEQAFTDGLDIALN